MQMKSGAIPYNATLASLAGLGTAANKGIYTTAASTWAEMDVSTFIRTVLDDAAAANVLTTLGVSAFIQTLLDDADAATARTTIGALTTGQSLAIATGNTRR